MVTKIYIFDYFLAYNFFEQKKKKKKIIFKKKKTARLIFKIFLPIIELYELYKYSRGFIKIFYSFFFLNFYCFFKNFEFKIYINFNTFILIYL